MRCIVLADEDGHYSREAMRLDRESLPHAARHLDKLKYVPQRVAHKLSAVGFSFQLLRGMKSSRRAKNMERTPIHSAAGRRRPGNGPAFGQAEVCPTYSQRGIQ
jgi:hypothetical protein